MPCHSCLKQWPREQLGPDVFFPLTLEGVVAAARSVVGQSHEPRRICGCGILFCAKREDQSPASRQSRHREILQRALEGSGLDVDLLLEDAKKIAETLLGKPEALPREDLAIGAWLEGSGPCPSCQMSTQPIETSGGWVCPRCRFHQKGSK